MCFASSGIRLAFVEGLGNHSDGVFYYFYLQSHTVVSGLQWHIVRVNDIMEYNYDLQN